jgi:hypothetical protein
MSCNGAGVGVGLVTVSRWYALREFLSRPDGGSMVVCNERARSTYDG